MVSWDDDASAGGWIAERLGPFGPRVDGTVPRGYAAYACVPHPDGYGCEEEVAAAQAEAWDQLATTLVERPAAPMLLLPHREYHLWTGTLADVAAFRHHDQSPNLWWPEDRSWFVGSEIDAAATYLGGSEALVDAVCAEAPLGAYRVAPSDEMLFEDD